MPKLPAGCCNIATTTGPDVRIDSACSQNALECPYGLISRSLPWQAGNFVVANQIDVRPHSTCQRSQLRGVFTLIVDRADQDVFEGDLRPVRPNQVWQASSSSSIVE